MKPFPRWHLLTWLLVLIVSTGARATHIRAGEIVIEQLEDCGLTVRATVYTYAKASMNAADEDTIVVDWGDGMSTKAGRINGPNNKGLLLGNDIKLNIYEAYHTYAARSTYLISTTDHNRNAGILNIPNSVFTPMYIATTYTFLNPQFQGCNSTPVILQPPIDFGCVGRRFVHNPNAYDPDGDSLAFFLTQPLFGPNMVVPGYTYPTSINPGPNNQMTMDAVTGQIVWDAPQIAGDYNIAMYIIEYRNGTPIDTVIRDMQIIVYECDNHPPEIEPVDDICVIAGDTVRFDIVATDPDTGQQVLLQAYGAPLSLPLNPAQFTVPAGFTTPPVTGHFEWPTRCAHISNQYYSMVFRAEDNYFGDTTGLTTLEQVRIKVVGPPPQDVQAEPEDDHILISWVAPYACENAADDYFRTFTVWRRENSNQFVIDTCTPGLAGQGYQKITPATQDLVNGRYQFADYGVEKGHTYCYRVLAEFAHLSAGGYPYNIVESLPSDEVCVQLGRDLPLLTEVSVLNTGTADGSVHITWTKPRAADLDTVQNPGPYRYQLLRASGFTPEPNDPVPGADFTAPTFAQANDTSFTDTNLNTDATPYTYRVAFYVNGQTEPLGYSPAASSVFLTVAPTDKRNVLTWDEQVPWDNYSYTVFRRNPGAATYDSIATVTGKTYADTGLVNGQEYCYYIRSMGSYGVADIASPLINFSQRVCAVPKDNIAPCPPKLTVSNVCDDGSLVDANGNFYNLLTWTHPASRCGTDDVAGFHVYFAPQLGDSLQLVDIVPDTEYIHLPAQGIAGCYTVTAFDSTGNESARDTIICVDNCPTYELPNTFTPNGDGQNDLFVPYPYHFIEAIEMRIYNQWGNLVFETRDPAIRWDGTGANGHTLPTGTYYYTCKVFERRVDGIRLRPGLMSGFIELIRE